MSRKKYGPRSPRYAAGIRLQEARGAAARSWWAKRWLEALQAKDLGGRFGRARAYAMSGQVVEIGSEETISDFRLTDSRLNCDNEPIESEIENRLIGNRLIENGHSSFFILHSSLTASVLGVRAEPYRVALRFRSPEGEARARLVARLRAEPMLVARLLAGDLPTEVEGLFRAEGCDLFPGGKLGEGVYDVTTACTCPDYANPCKHSLAALLVLGEEIAWRPWRLLELRGIPMEELCDED